MRDPKRVAVAVAIGAALMVTLTSVIPTRAAALGDGRAYELVNTNDVGNDALGSMVAVSDDGHRVMYLRRNATPSFMTATRSAGGWQPVSMNPPAAELLDASYTGIFALTPDRTQVFAGAFAGSVGQPGTSTIVRLDATGRQSVFATLPTTEPGRQNLDVVVTDDGRHAFSNLVTPFDPGHVAGQNVYDIAANPPVLVSRLPDGSVPACGTSGGFASQTKASTMVQHWVSADGAWIFFLSRGSTDCSAPFILYRRDLTSGTTVQISGAGSSATFLQAAADGSTVVYETAESLAPDDGNSDPDVYRWTAGGGNDCLTCVVADANVSPIGAFDQAVGVSEDLSHLYFASASVLGPADTDGTTSLYVWHVVNGVRTIDYIAPILLSGNSLTNNAAQAIASVVTPDGNTLLFTSGLPGLDALTGRSNGGKRQYYRYDDRTGDLTCVSCPASGPPTTNVLSMASGGIGPEGYQRVVSADGRRFVFRTADALVPADVDGGPDLYEWHDGQVDLISDGVTTPTGTLNRASNLLRGISADGTDVIFSSYSVLTPDASPGSQHIYDARIGGGFKFPSGAPCDGDGCQSPPLPPPLLPFAGTARFSGAGDVVPAVQRAKATVRLAKRLGADSALLVRVRVPGSGTIVAAGQHLKRTARSVKRAGTYSLHVALDRSMHTALARHGHLRVTVRVQYRSSSGGPVSAQTLSATVKA